MPEYMYRCDGCGDEFCIRQSIKDDSLVTCEDCGGELYRVIHATPFFIDKEPQTLGHLADRNRDKMGAMERSDKLGAKPKIDSSTWYNPSGKLNPQLGNMTRAQTKKYIETGTLPDGTVDTEKVDVGRLKNNLAKAGIKDES